MDWRIWWIYGIRALRLQLAVIILILMILFPYYWTNILWVNSLFFLGLLSAFLFNCYTIFPFTPFSKVELPDADHSVKNQISFFTCNVRMKNEDYQKLVKEIIRFDPDVILLTEVNKKWIEAIKEIREQYKFTCLCPQENTYGMAMYAKYPLEKTEVNYLVEDNIPSFRCHINWDGTTIQFLGLHPRPPAPWNKEEHKDLELIKAAGITNWNSFPTVVSGDLNDVAWSPVTHQFKLISGLVDPRRGRGFFSTYNVFTPGFRMPIDHFFLSEDFRVIKINRGQKIGSDHFPIFLEVGISQ
jgi:endonuclease/exonuclease/phosphatase (EEP) superfamily protein YafD